MVASFCVQGIVYSIDEMTGGLVISHRLILPTRDYPGCPGPVSCIKWTPDGTALAMAWQHGGFSIWSTFGAMIMCSLCWDYGPNVSDPVVQNPLCIKSMVLFYVFFQIKAEMLADCVDSVGLVRRGLSVVACQLQKPDEAHFGQPVWFLIRS